MVTQFEVIGLALVVKLKVIEGGKAQLEEKILQDMFRGEVSSEDIDRLRPCGDLSLVSSDGKNSGHPPRAQRSFSIPIDWLDDKTV